MVAVINKIDAASAEKVQAARERLAQEPWLNSVLEISAAKEEGLEALEEKLRQFLLPGPKYFPDDMVTDQPERVVCAEMIREQALLLLREEVPHGIGVDIDKMLTRPDGLVEIWATIYCERDGHKGIIIGKGGSMLKKIGSQAREQIEWMLGSRVHLQLWVKVKEDWRNSPSTMRMLGYEND